MNVYPAQPARWGHGAQAQGRIPRAKTGNGVGAKDQAVPISRSELALASMKKVGHTVLEVKDLGAFNTIGKETMVYRAVPDAPHNVFLPWETRGRQELGKMLGWLLKHQRATPADLPAAEKALAEWGRKFNWKPGGTLGAYDAKPADR